MNILTEPVFHFRLWLNILYLISSIGAFHCLRMVWNWTATNFIRGFPTHLDINMKKSFASQHKLFGEIAAASGYRSSVDQINWITWSEKFLSFPVPLKPCLLLLGFWVAKTGNITYWDGKTWNLWPEVRNLFSHRRERKEGRVWQPCCSHYLHGPLLSDLEWTISNVWDFSATQTTWKRIATK